MQIVVQDKNGRKIAESWPSSQKEIREIRARFAELPGASKMFEDGKPVTMPNKNSRKK
jgi:hypothetical protein